LGLLADVVGGPGRVMGVLKAGAYGHGTVEAARALRAGGVRSFGVATLDEGVALREAKVGGSLLLLGAVDARHAREASRYRVGLTVWNRAYLDEASAGLKSGERLDVHLKVDTGMARLGFFPEEVPGVLGDFHARRWKGLRLASAFTHLACADERPDKASAAQLKAFGDLPWPEGLPLHAAASAAALRYPQARRDFVRSGIFLYGALEPAVAPQAKLQKPVLKAYASVLRVVQLPKGAGVSYGHTYRAPKAMRLATVCAGYADGMPRALSNRGFVRIRGVLCPIVGRICMDLFMADVSKVGACVPGDRVGLLEDLEGPCSALGWARLTGTCAYEILCGLSGRLPRRWVDG
jgi:alanine racemase